MTVEVAYANPEQQVIITLEIHKGATAEQAIKASGILSQFPEIDIMDFKVGVFGKICKREKLLSQADRVEVYRPLTHDPKEARRQRAAK